MTAKKNMCIYISRLAVSLVLLLPLTVMAQGGKKKIAPSVEPDTIPFYRGVAVSVDAVGPGMLLFGDYGQLEGSVRVNLKDKYFPTIELGLGKSDATDDVTLITYKTSAPFVRIGCDYNLTKNKHDIYRVLGGVRYAFSSYKYDVSHPGVTDPIWGDVVMWGSKDMKGNCHWLEFGVGVDAKIWGPIRLGWSARYRKRLMHKDDDMGAAWYVPGFGKKGNSRLGALFNITVEL